MNTDAGPTNNSFVIAVSKMGIQLNPGLKISFRQTNIPAEDLSFHSKPTYWLLKQKSFEPGAKLLKVEVLDYNTSLIDIFLNQVPKKEIHKLHFEYLDWEPLQEQVFGFKKLALRKNPIIRGFSELEPEPQAPFKSTLPEEDLAIQDQGTEEKEGHQIELRFSKKLEALCFGLGSVSFKKHIPQLQKSLDFEIQNPYLLPEFDYIKPWFAKALKTKNVVIDLLIKVSLDNQILSKSAKSKTLNRIDEALIETVKFQRSLGFTKKPLLNAPDKSLFGAEDFFDGNQEDPSAGNVFGQSPEDLMNDLLNAKDVRNKRNIQYLARLQSPSLPLKFTQHPDFGFLFFIEGQSQHHFAWELLDSHATYLWSFEKETSSIPQQYARIEAILSKLRIMKREPYKRAYKEGLIDSDLVFIALHHSHKNSSLVDSFPRWRHALMEKLV